MNPVGRLREFAVNRLAPVIGQSAYAFVLPGDPVPSDADIRLTRRLDEGARILQINMLDHIIVGQSLDDRPGYFSFKEAGLIRCKPPRRCSSNSCTIFCQLEWI